MKTLLAMLSAGCLTWMHAGCGQPEAPGAEQIQRAGITRTEDPCHCGFTGDPAYTPPVEHPVHEPGRGPLILYDEAHYNGIPMSPRAAYPQKEGPGAALGRMIEADGYRLRINRDPFTAQSLSDVKVLFVVHAAGAPFAVFDPQASSGTDQPRCFLNTFQAALPAFSAEEVEALTDWVSAGGSLIHIYEHPPYSEAAQILASEFGVDLHHPHQVGPLATFDFSADDGSITEPSHPIFRGRRDSEAIVSLPSFNLKHHTTSQGRPLLRFKPGTYRKDITLEGEHAFQRLLAFFSGVYRARFSLEDLCTLQNSQSTTQIGAAAAFSEIRYRNDACDPGGRVFTFGEGSKIQVVEGQPGGLRDPDNRRFFQNLIRYAAGDLR